MASKQVALELAAFLDSDPARGLRGPSRDEVKRIAEAFLGVCYEELGKAPRFLDGEDVRELLGRGLPGRLRRADPLAEHVPGVLAAFLDHLESVSVVTQAFEIRRALEAALPAFREEVESGRSALRSVQREKPFVHGASKLGRNDPCSCGSGKKYKKCHGREG